MAVSSSAQDVADALAMTLEREGASGAPWCPPSDATALRRWIIDRSAALGTGIRRAVRLARLMAIADGRDYARFLYVRLPALRARHFREALEAAFAEGRIDAGVATLFDAGVRLREAVLLPQAGAHDVFEIDFAQMPRLGALLDILHNALGFTVVADLLAPVLGQAPHSANEVARRLQASLNAWLSERLDSTSHIQQARRMRAFLARRGRVAPEAIDDEAILQFWTAMAESAEEERIDGFRLYRSAAAAMLRYRNALRDAATTRFLEDAFTRGLDAANDELGQQAAEWFEPWRSPLCALASPPANRVKWLTGRELNGLVNYLGEPSDSETESIADDSSTADVWNGGLGGEERFDVAFWLTLLRTDVFGAAQASIVGQLRKRATGRMAIAQAMAQIDDMAYTTAASFYANLRQQLRFESLAALAILMEEGAMEAVLLLDALGGPNVVSVLIGQTAANHALAGDDDPPDDSLHSEIAPILKKALAAPGNLPEGPARTLLQEAIAATRKVNRIGFRREDRPDLQMLAALRVGATEIFAVVRELDRLTATLLPKAPTADLNQDRERFAATFRRIYLA